MNEWKQAFSLAKFELKVSIVNILLCWFIMTFFSLIFFTSFSSYIENNYVGFDIFFVLGLSFIPLFFRSKHYQYQKYGDEFYASPTFIMMTQLPIPKGVLVKSRLLITFVYLLPFMVTIFPIIYLFIPGISEVMGLPAYGTFFIIWLSLIIIFGMMLPASDPGDKVTILIMTVYFIVTFLILFIIISFFYQILGYGIVAFVIHLASNWALISIVVSIVLVFVSWKFWTYHMTKTAKKLDYM